jgi:hypothetical protein
VHLVQSARVETIKIGKGKKAKQESVIVVDYCAVLNKDQIRYFRAVRAVVIDVNNVPRYDPMNDPKLSRHRYVSPQVVPDPSRRDLARRIPRSARH